jgi:hypothetical protein
MSIPDVDGSIMVICAADADQIWHTATHDGKNQGANPVLPKPGDPATTGIGYVNTTNFQALGQLRCDDIFLTHTDQVYYGLVLSCLQPVGPVRPGDLLITIHGTLDPQEWINNAAAAFMRDFHNAAGAHQGAVSAGFFEVYESMMFYDLGGGGKNATKTALSAIVNGLNPGASVYVCGHSLGSAIATYLCHDLVDQLIVSANRLKVYLFASPKTGDHEWVTYYATRVSNYQVSNYALDLVPRVPPIGVDLSNASLNQTVFEIPANSPGNINGSKIFPFNAAVNHSPSGYSRMLNPPPANTSIADGILIYQKHHGQA